MSAGRSAGAAPAARAWLDRRQLLAALGWTAAGITLVGCGLIPPRPVIARAQARDALAWLQVLPDGRVLFRCPIHEYGQGAPLGLAQIVAEELGVAPERIALELPDTGTRRPHQGTFGSYAIAQNARPLAEAAAGLREALRARAAARAGVAPERMADAPGDAGGFVGPDGAVYALAALAAGPAIVVEPADLPRAAPRSFATGARRWVGHEVAAPELRAIVTGEVQFAGDVRLPDMLYGALLTPPVPGAELVRASLDRARRLPGYAGGLVDARRGLAGVVAETPFALPALVAAIDAEWRRPPPFEQADLEAALDVDRRLARGALEDVLVDELGAGDRRGAWDVDVRVTTPLAAHASIEVRAGVAHWTGGRCEIWVGTQDAFFTRASAARTLGLGVEQVVIHGQRMGGAFGGRVGFEGVEAALLARAVGRPVKVQWTRPDEFQRGYHGPPTSHRVRARLGADGRVTAWWHAVVSGHVLLNPLVLPTWLEAATGFVHDEGTSRGLRVPYALGRRRLEVTTVRLPIATGAWRGLGAAPNALAVETAIDALARAARADPLAFRLRLLGAAPASQAPLARRLARCLERAGALAEWSGDRTAPGRGRAIAAGTYHDMTCVAVVADVVAGGAGEAPRVERLVCVQDCGAVVNPDRVRAQLEGNLVWAIGYALMHELRVAGGRVTADYLTQYPLPTIAHVPPLVLELIDPGPRGDLGGRPPAGAGEPAVTAATAAIAAAAARALGDGERPVRALPVRRAR